MSYYDRPEDPERQTVGALIAQLQAFDPALPVSALWDSIPSMRVGRVFFYQGHVTIDCDDDMLCLFPECICGHSAREHIGLESELWGQCDYHDVRETKGGWVRFNECDCHTYVAPAGSEVPKFTP